MSITILVTFILIWLGISRANNSQARTAQQALDGTYAWLINLASILIIALVVVPFAWRYVSAYVPGQYAQIITDIGGAASSLRPPSQPRSLPLLTLPSIPQVQPTITVADPPTLLPESGGSVPDAHQGQVIAIENNVQYVVVGGDNIKKIADRYSVTIEEIVDANSLPDPDKITVGQVLLIPQTVQVTATPASTPIPTIVPTPEPEVVTESSGESSSAINLDQVFVEIGGYRLNGDMELAENALQAILRTHPGNESATAILGEIASYKQLREYWQELDREGEGVRLVNPETELFYNESQSEYVDGLLSGHEFEIVEYEDFLARTTNAEIMVVRCITPGWLYGTEFTIQAIHGTKRGANEKGDKFKV